MTSRKAYRLHRFTQSALWVFGLSAVTLGTIMIVIGAVDYGLTR